MSKFSEALESGEGLLLWTAQGLEHLRAVQSAWHTRFQTKRMRRLYGGGARPCHAEVFEEILVRLTRNRLLWGSEIYALAWRYFVKRSGNPRSSMKRFEDFRQSGSGAEQIMMLRGKYCHISYRWEMDNEIKEALDKRRPVTMLHDRKTIFQSPTQLYRHFDKDGRLLYVGISLSTVVRLAQHKQQSRWFGLIARIEIEQHSCREDAIEAEMQAISEEKPLFNVVGNVHRICA